MSEETQLLVNEFFSDHPEQLIGYTTQKIGGKDFTSMDRETAMAFSMWLMSRNGLSPEVQEQRLAKIQELYGRK